ncbi:hypothetical protein RE6C_04001 [Rhodopirellula europaea 6C]|uniref:Uncharacterized protein n=1 Tax=Rhodopirellula europaea 6C TaxID=1263867 RepID=M2ARB4_9BACT|nr:hypothetical protein RE6C_04001 [Rhodopirellula europaea 6C]
MVPGGWIVSGTLRSGDSPAYGMTFVPDPQHTWDGSSVDQDGG